MTMDQQKWEEQFVPSNQDGKVTPGGPWREPTKNTRPWRFPGHIQRLHRKAEEERQQRHSLVDQWLDMILKGYVVLV